MTTTAIGSGTATEPADPSFAQTIIVIGRPQPGRVVRIVFVTLEEARQLPLIPDEALQIAVAPAGGL